MLHLNAPQGVKMLDCCMNSMQKFTGDTRKACHFISQLLSVSIHTLGINKGNFNPSTPVLVMHTS